MSFFGLTSFGPESIISASKVDCNAFSLYSDEEFLQAFQQLTNQLERPYLLDDDLAALLKLTIGFKPLESEVLGSTLISTF